MSQNDFVISNQTAPAFRADLNSALQALASVSSGATEPATKYANMLWYDTGTNTLKKRNEANSAWINIGTFDEGAGTFSPSGVVMPDIASEADALAGTNNTKMMTPLRDRQALEALAEGASGAPKIKTAALQPPSAGTSYLIMRLQEAEEQQNGVQIGGFLDANLHNRNSSGSHLGVTCLVSGTITAYLEHRNGNRTSSVRVLKNGVQVASWSNSSTTYAARQVNIAVDVGDAVIFQQSRPSGDDVYCYWRRLRIYSNNPNFAVA